MMRLRVGGLIGLFAVLALTVSGCDFEEEFFPPTSVNPLSRTAADTSSIHPTQNQILLRIFFEDPEEYLEGYYEPIGPTEAAIHNKIVIGHFRGRLPSRYGIFGRPAAASSRSQAHAVTGTYVADLNGTTDSSNGTAQMTAIGALDFKASKQGVACFEMTAKFTNNGSAGEGTFRSTGGTKASATSRFSGSFTDTVASNGSNKKDSGKLTGTAKLGKKAKPPPEDCKALLKKLP